MKFKIFLPICYFGIIFNIIGCTHSKIDLTSEDWIKDLDYMSQQLPKLHKNLYFQLSENTFNQKINVLKTQLDSLSDKEILFHLMKIVSSIGDAHTNIDYNKWKFNLLPLYTYVCEDGLLILGTDEQYKFLIGKQLLKINDFNICEIQNKIKSLIPHENEYWLKEKIPEYIINADILKFINIIDSTDSIKLSYLDNDTTNHVELTPIISNHVSAIRFVYYFNYLNLELPIAWRFGNKNYWFEYFDEENAIYFQYNQCINMRSESFSQFSDRLFKTIDQKQVENLIVDVRFNTGGNSDLFSNYFSPKLNSYIAKNELNIYTIIGRRTFSSGLWVASELSKNCNSILIGEPTGNKPNHYGDNRKFKLPKSQLIINYSTRYWKMSETEEDALYPDNFIKIKSKDILVGRDLFLENTLKLLNNKL